LGISDVSSIGALPGLDVLAISDDYR